MKLYSLVKEILEANPQARSSDKVCIWITLRKLGLVNSTMNSISYESLFNAPSFETITRIRRKLQERHPNLASNNPQINKLRRKKQLTKGTFIYHK